MAAQGVLAVAIGSLTTISPFISPGLAKDADGVSLVAQAKSAGAPVKLSQATPNSNGSNPSPTALQHR